jgi:hypothetical protein
MSWDFYFWKTSSEDDPAVVVDRLADERADCLVGDDQVLAFRSEVLRRWPDLVHRIEPWHTDLPGTTPWGRTDLADHFVILTLQWGWEDQPGLIALAKEYGLLCYDPQISKFA